MVSKNTARFLSSSAENWYLALNLERRHMLQRLRFKLYLNVIDLLSGAAILIWINHFQADSLSLDVLERYGT